MPSVTAPLQAFSDLPLPPQQLSNLKDLGYVTPTEIQAQTLPLIFEKKDVIAQAKTGSGKTAAFALGLLQHLQAGERRPQALVICPTRELAEQVAGECRRLARCLENIKVLTLCGGQPFGYQRQSLEHGAHIIVGTPGRLLEHQRKGFLNLQALQTLVLDEADRMLDMGFIDAISTLAQAITQAHQTLLFSATYPSEIEALSQRFQEHPTMVKATSHHAASSLQQTFHEVPHAEKLDACLNLLRHHQPSSAILFCNTKKRCAEVAHELTLANVPTLALHGDLEQRQRDQVLTLFANHSYRFLTATDVAARGIDIAGLPLVLNVDLSRDTDVHVHRIGRTGRSGSSGLAISLFQPSEVYKLGALEKDHDMVVDVQPLPSLSARQDIPSAPMETLEIQGGKKIKIRPGDILGALIQGGGLSKEQIGKINIFDFVSYVALNRGLANKLVKSGTPFKIKGKSLKVRRLRSS